MSKYVFIFAITHEHHEECHHQAPVAQSVRASYLLAVLAWTAEGAEVMRGSGVRTPPGAFFSFFSPTYLTTCISFPDGQMENIASTRKAPVVLQVLTRVLSYGMTKTKTTKTPKKARYPKVSLMRILRSSSVAAQLVLPAKRLRYRTQLPSCYSPMIP